LIFRVGPRCLGISCSRSVLWGLLVICIFGIAPFTSRAQHTKHEVEIAIAFDGQLPLVRNKDQLGFFTNPFIGRFQYQALTNGVQSLSVFLETVSETRTRDDLYSSSPRAPFNAQIAESVHLTSLGLEMVRTLLVAGDLRIAGGIDIGFGLGRPTLDVTNKTNDSTEHVESLSTWACLQPRLFEAVIRSFDRRTGTSDYCLPVVTGRSLRSGHSAKPPTFIMGLHFEASTISGISSESRSAFSRALLRQSRCIAAQFHRNMRTRGSEKDCARSR
jgi:hypothetical protein